jgi:NDP-sugar pyrophosphorylase family protein
MERPSRILNRPMPIPELLVLAGGYGSRLQSVVSAVPKPLAPVAGRPYLDYLVDCWIEQGVEQLTFLLHHKAEQLQEFIGAKQCHLALEGRSCQLRYLVEKAPLGTGGAIVHAVRSLGITSDFLVANADTWLGTGIRQLSQRGGPGIAIVEVANAARYGAVSVKNSRIVAFEEKQVVTGNGWINAGLYSLSAELFNEFQDGRSFSIERELFPRFVSRRQLKAIKLTTEFIDIGVPDDYFRFCRWIESGKVITI